MTIALALFKISVTAIGQASGCDAIQRSSVPARKDRSNQRVSPVAMGWRRSGSWLETRISIDLERVLPPDPLGCSDRRTTADDLPRSQTCDPGHEEIISRPARSTPGAVKKRWKRESRAALRHVDRALQTPRTGLGRDQVTSS